MSIRLIKMDHKNSQHGNDLIMLLNAYEKLGFSGYELDPTIGHALFGERN